MFSLILSLPGWVATDKSSECKVKSCIPMSCFNNNTLKRSFWFQTMVIGRESLKTKKAFRKNVCFCRYIDKISVRDVFFWQPAWDGTLIIRALCHVPSFVFVLSSFNLFYHDMTLHLEHVMATLAWPHRLYICRRSGTLCVLITSFWWPSKDPVRVLKMNYFVSKLVLKYFSLKALEHGTALLAKLHPL